MKLIVRNFKKYEKNTMKAFCDLEFLDLCLVIKGCTVHQKAGKAWVGFPGRKYKTEDGKTAWANIIEFSDKEKQEEFRKTAVAIIRKFVEMEKEKEAMGDKPEEKQDAIPF